MFLVSVNLICISRRASYCEDKAKVLKGSSHMRFFSCAAVSVAVTDFGLQVQLSVCQKDVIPEHRLLGSTAGVLLSAWADPCFRSSYISAPSADPGAPQGGGCHTSGDYLRTWCQLTISPWCPLCQGCEPLVLPALGSCTRKPRSSSWRSLSSLSNLRKSQCLGNVILPLT